MKKAAILLCALACFLLVACMPKTTCNTDADCVPKDPLLGVQYLCVEGKCTEKVLGNPATEFCLQNGGRIEMKTVNGQELGICVFADGSECEQFAFYRNECKPGDSKRAVVTEPKIEMLGCEQYLVPGKICPTEMDPVCAKVEMPTGVRWITFKNACLACKAAQRPATKITYKKGTCQ